jgi:hypothetical protein
LILEIEFIDILLCKTVGDFVHRLAFILYRYIDRDENQADLPNLEPGSESIFK